MGVSHSGLHIITRTATVEQRCRPLSARPVDGGGDCGWYRRVVVAVTISIEFGYARFGYRCMTVARPAGVFSGPKGFLLTSTTIRVERESESERSHLKHL